MPADTKPPCGCQAEALTYAAGSQQLRLSSKAGLAAGQRRAEAQPGTKPRKYRIDLLGQVARGQHHQRAQAGHAAVG